MQAPHIRTAVPRRRYQVGEYNVVVLGEIESNDPIFYRFVMAVVPEGENVPVFYVVSEKARRGEAVQGSHRLRVVAERLNEDLGVSDRWADLDAFAEEGLLVIRKALGLMDEHPFQLM